MIECLLVDAACQRGPRSFRSGSLSGIGGHKSLSISGGRIELAATGRNARRGARPQLARIAGDCVRRYGWLSLLLMPLAVGSVMLLFQAPHLSYIVLVVIAACCAAQAFALAQLTNVLIESPRMRRFLICAAAIPVFGSFVLESGSAACLTELREHGLKAGRLGVRIEVIEQMQASAEQGQTPPPRLNSRWHK